MLCLKWRCFQCQITTLLYLVSLRFWPFVVSALLCNRRQFSCSCLWYSSVLCPAASGDYCLPQAELINWIQWQELGFPVNQNFILAHISLHIKKNAHREVNFPKNMDLENSSQIQTNTFWFSNSWMTHESSDLTTQRYSFLNLHSASNMWQKWKLKIERTQIIKSEYQKL